LNHRRFRGPALSKALVLRCRAKHWAFTTHLAADGGAKELSCRGSAMFGTPLADRSELSVREQDWRGELPGGQKLPDSTSDHKKSKEKTKWHKVKKSSVSTSERPTR
jgi:hypothetical protein